MIDKIRKDREIISEIGNNLERIKRTLKINREEVEVDEVNMKEPECIDDELDYITFNLENILKITDDINDILIGGVKDAKANR